MQTRLHALDGARGFTVLFMPAIHTVMVFSQPYVHTTWLGYFLTFIAEGPGAQIFMTIMGIAFTFKQKHRAAAIFKRSLLLLLAGYILNFLKFGVPFLIGALPVEVQHELQLTPGRELTGIVLIGDILHFAAMAMIVLHVMYRVTHYHYWSLVLIITIVFVSPYCFDSAPDHYLIQLFTGGPPQVFFPVLPWLVYPLMGLIIGGYLRTNRENVFFACLCIGVGFLATGAVYAEIFPNDSSHGFYRTFPGETMMHMAVVLIALFVWDEIARRYWLSDFFQLFSFCSKHITVIYIFQWIFICWLLPFIGYQTMNLLESLITACWMTSIVIGLTYLFKRKQKIHGYE